MRYFFAGYYTNQDATKKVRVDYSTFGMQMPQRNGSFAHYRMGFNGQEKDDEVAGKGNISSALFWMYDTRIARRWNLDPVVKPWESGYAVFGNNPIAFNDIAGDNREDAIKLAKEARNEALKVVKVGDIKSYHHVHQVLYNMYKLHLLDPNETKTNVNIVLSEFGKFYSFFRFSDENNEVKYYSGNIDVGLNIKGGTFNTVLFNSFIVPLTHEYIHRYQTAVMGLGGENNRAEREFLANEFNLFPNDSYMRTVLPEWDVEFVEDFTDTQKLRWATTAIRHYKAMSQEKRDKYKDYYDRVVELQQELINNEVELK